jgi:hypothetical protein
VGTPHDPWIAAQSLTFLKRSSPAGEHKKLGNFSMGVSPISKSRGGGGGGASELSTVPSVASSSDGTRTEDASGSDPQHRPYESTPESTLGNKGNEEDSALFLAAVAMTEFGQSPLPSTSMLSVSDRVRRYLRDDGDEVDDDEQDDEEEKDVSFGKETSPERSKRLRSSKTNERASKVSPKRYINFDEVMSTPRRKRRPRYLDEEKYQL